MDIASLGLEVRSDQVRAANDALSKFQGEAGKAENAAKRLTMQAGSMRNAFAAATAALGVTFGGAAFATGMLNAVKRMEAIEVASRKIDKALQLNGYSWDLTTRKVIAFAEAMEKRTGRNKMEVLDLAPNLASFGFTEKVALRSIELANDMSAAWGGDLRQNFEGLARALADPVKGFAMLSMRGIQLDDTQKKLVKSLVESGQGLKAQEVVFEALEAQIKGVAEAGYTPLAKATDAASKSIETFFERLVSSQGAGSALIAVLNGISAAMTYLGDNIGVIAAGLGIFAGAHIISGVVALTGAVQGLTAGLGLAAIAARALSLAMAFVGGPIGLAVIALGAAYLLLRDNVSAAEQAAQDANSAYATNVQAMKLAEGASGKYSQALRDQIAMQVEVARSAVTMAEATFESALATRNAFRALTGLEFAPLEHNTDVALKNVNALDFALAKLEEQLAKVDKNLAKPLDLPSRNFGGPSDSKKHGKTEAEKYSDIVDGASRRIASLKAEQAAIGLTDEAAAKLRYTQDLLNQAQQKGITLSAAQEAELAGLAGQMAATEAATKKAQEALDFAKDVTRGFIDDLRYGLEQGKGFWESFGNAALNVLDRIVDKLLDDVLNAIFQVNQAGAGGGGILGGLLGLLGGGGFKDGAGGGLGALLGYASGGYTGNGAASRVAGVVHGGEYVFSKRATDRIGVGALEQLHNHAKGYERGGYVAPAPRVQAAGNQNGPQETNVHVTVGWSRDADGNLKPFIEDVSQKNVKAGIAQYDKGSTYRASRDLREASSRGYMR